MKELSQTQFETEIQGDKPVLVDFWAPWCVHCRRIAPALESIEAEMGQSCTIAKLNIDAEPAIARQENIAVIPTLILYRAGKRLGSITAADAKAKIEDFLRQTLGR